jgi:hypothetical protein
MMSKLLTLLIVFSLTTCDHKYARGVKQDTQRIFSDKKEFINSFSFRGIVGEKKYCERCELNKYQLVLNLEEMNPTIVALSNQAFQPYYFFGKTNQLTIAVTSGLYNLLKEGTIVSKESSSDFINYGDAKFRLLSEKKTKWLPE